MEARFNDAVTGMVLGGAVGDALGLSTEFMQKEDVVNHYSKYGGCIPPFGEFYQDAHRSQYSPGEWSDDTHQSVLLLDCMLEVDSYEHDNIPHLCKLFAAKLKGWVLGGALDIGRQTRNIVSRDTFVADPIGESTAVWVRNHKTIAANGAVSRTAILVLSVLCLPYPEAVKQLLPVVRALCQVTHYDPRCVASCVALSIALLQILILNNRDTKDITEKAVRAGEAELSEETLRPGTFEAVSQEFRKLMTATSLEALCLDDKLTMGYTLKCVASGFWCLRHAQNFQQGMTELVMCGGDADTNGAVAGSLMGCYWGVQNIPDKWIEGLDKPDRDTLLEKVRVLCGKNVVQEENPKKRAKHVIDNPS